MGCANRKTRGVASQNNLCASKVYESFDLILKVQMRLRKQSRLVSKLDQYEQNLLRPRLKSLPFQPSVVATP